MFDVIDFFESVGQDAQLRYASSEEIVATLAGQSIDSKLRDAILTKDVQGLGTMLGQDVFCCYINPAKVDEDEEKKNYKGKDDKDGKDDIDKDNSDKRAA